MTNRAGKQIDTKRISDPVLRDGIERLIERIFGTYPEDYSFGDKGLKYDSSANTVKHIGCFVESFRLLNVKDVRKISLFPMKTSVVPGFTTIDKTILIQNIFL
ncbi:hypothetical protein LPJ66_002545, partial [Kickxella alabastrina]